MSGGSGVKGDLREHYTPLPAGTVLWHVYPSKYEPRAFNPSSRNRFALVPPPNQAMFYAGDISACALWEAVLRNLVVDDKQPQHVDSARSTRLSSAGTIKYRGDRAPRRSLATVRRP